MNARLALLATALVLATAARVHAQAAPRCPPCACPAADEAEGRTASTPIDLNQASEAMLVALPGIGPARARAILAYRAEHGGFRSVSQLLHIRGIGRALLKQLRPLVTLGPRPGAG